MQVKNNSARAYTVRSVILVPGTVTELDDAFAADIKDLTDLEVVDKPKAAATEPTAKELRATLDEIGIEYPSNASKTDLAALLSAQ